MLIITMTHFTSIHMETLFSSWESFLSGNLESLCGPHGIPDTFQEPLRSSSLPKRTLCLINKQWFVPLCWIKGKMFQVRFHQEHTALILPEKHNESSDNIPVGRKHQSRFKTKGKSVLLMRNQIK